MIKKCILLLSMINLLTFTGCANNEIKNNFTSGLVINSLRNNKDKTTHITKEKSTVGLEKIFRL